MLSKHLAYKSVNYSINWNDSSVNWWLMLPKSRKTECKTDPTCRADCTSGLIGSHPVKNSGIQVLSVRNISSLFFISSKLYLHPRAKVTKKYASESSDRTNENWMNFSEIRVSSKGKLGRFSIYRFCSWSAAVGWSTGASFAPFRSANCHLRPTILWLRLNIQRPKWSRKRPEYQSTFR